MTAQTHPEAASLAGTRRLRLNAKQIAFFNRQLASMAKLNMPIARGLKVMAREVGDPVFKTVVSGVQRDLEEGRTLQEALGRYPATFSDTYLEILRAGESTGNLAVVLDELTAYTEAVTEIRVQLRDSMLYPGVISILTAIFTLGFFWFIIPNFAALFASAGRCKIVDGMITDITPTLAFSTRTLFVLSNFLRNPFVVLLGAVLTFGGGAYAVHKIRRGWETYDEYMFRIPLFGNLIRMATLMKVTRTMRDLLTNGVSMVNTLRLTAGIAGNNRIRKQLNEIRASVEEGGSFSRSLTADAFTETIVWKLQMGEEKGIVEDALAEVANELERDIATTASYLTAVIAPLMLVAMALVVMLLMLSLYPQLIGIATSVG